MRLITYHRRLSLWIYDSVNELNLFMLCNYVEFPSIFSGNKSFVYYDRYRTIYANKLKPNSGVKSYPCNRIDLRNNLLEGLVIELINSIHDIMLRALYITSTG